jgi:hypothetical protein
MKERGCKTLQDGRANPWSTFQPGAVIKHGFVNGDDAHTKLQKYGATVARERAHTGGQGLTKRLVTSRQERAKMLPETQEHRRLKAVPFCTV